ncbi:hypothetical protein ACVWW6_006037 [Bradyrhizobium sp. USDA 3311]
MASKVNPLLAAVLKEIPTADSSRAQRIAWLRLVAMTMDTVYGAPEGALELPDFLGAPRSEPAAAAAPVAIVAAPPPPARPQVVRSVEPPRFFIDHAGFARRNFDTGSDGRIEILAEAVPISSSEVGGDTLYDDRGEHGDLGSIVWADGSRGVLGKRLNISATPDRA